MNHCAEAQRKFTKWVWIRHELEEHDQMQKKKKTEIVVSSKQSKKHATSKMTISVQFSWQCLARMWTGCCSAHSKQYNLKDSQLPDLNSCITTPITGKNLIMKVNNDVNGYLESQNHYKSRYLCVSLTHTLSAVFGHFDVIPQPPIKGCVMIFYIFIIVNKFH